MKIETFTVPSVVTVEHTIEGVPARCPFADRADEYRVRVEIEASDLPETASLTAWFQQWAGEPVTQEKLAAEAYSGLCDELDGVREVTVTGTHGDVHTAVSVP